MRTLLALLALTTAAAARQDKTSAGVPQPRLNAIQPAGAKTGSIIDLKITSGVDLDGVDRLLFSHPGLKAELVREAAGRLHPNGRATLNAFKVTVGADVPAGVYEVRAAGIFGISNARRFVVGDLDEVLEKEPNNDPATAQEIALGTIVNGALDAQNFDAFRIKAVKGQRILADCQALRIDSRAQPVLTLLNGEGHEVRRVIGTKYRDPLLDFSVEQDGIFTILAYDLLYRGGPEYAYRFSVGTSPWIDYADPCILKPGADNIVTIFGRNLPGGAPAGVMLDGRPIEKVVVTIKAPSGPGTGLLESPLRPSDASADLVTWRLPGSNAIRFALGDEPLLSEVDDNNVADKAQGVTPPVQISGRFGARGDRDWVRFEAKKGDKLWIEVVSQRLGHPVDPQLVIQQLSKNEKGEISGKDIVDSDDQAQPMPAMGGNMEKRYRAQPEDPAALFTAPADGAYRVLVRDLFASSQGDPRFSYRLAIRPARPDYRLVAFPLETIPTEAKLNPVTCILRRGGSDRLRLVAFRREGFDGAIRIEAADLPPGVTARPAIIPPESTSIDLVLQAAPNAPAFAGSLRIHGWAVVDGKPVGRPALAAEALFGVSDMQKDSLVTRITENIALAVDDHFVAPLSLQTTDAPLRMSRGGKLKVPVRLAKQAEAKDLDKAQIKLAVAGLPGKANEKPVTVKELTLNLAKPEGELELDFTEKAPLGKITLHLTGDVEVAYLRCPERVKQVQEEQKRVDALLAEFGGELKKVQETKQKADAALQKAKAAKTDPAAVKTAEDELAAFAEAEKKSAELVKGAEQLKKELVEELKKVTEAAKEKKIKVWIASLPVEIEIVAAPASLKAADSLAVKAGEKADLAVDILREFGFADEVKIELVPPAGAALKLTTPLTVAGAAAQGTASISADKAVKPGAYAAVLRATFKFNTKPFTVDRAVEIKVE